MCAEHGVRGAPCNDSNATMKHTHEVRTRGDQERPGPALRAAGGDHPPRVSVAGIAARPHHGGKPPLCGGGANGASVVLLFLGGQAGPGAWKQVEMNSPRRPSIRLFSDIPIQLYEKTL